LDSAGNPVQIKGGARYVYRSTKRNFGGMVIQQAENEITPAQTFLVGRYSENVGKQNRVGMLFTGRLDDNENAYTGAIDGFFRLNQRLSLSYMGVANGNSGSTSSLGGYARLYHLSNHLIAYWTQSFIPENFSLPMGFVSRTNVIATTPGFYFRHHYKWLPKFIRFSEPGLYVEVYHQASTRKLQESSININPVWLAFQNGGGFGYFTFLYEQNIADNFNPLEIPIQAGHYRYTRHKLYYFTDRSKKISWTLNYDFGKYYNGELSYYEGNLRIAPIPNVSFSFNYGQNVFEKVGESDERKSVRLYSVESRLALNPRMQLISFFQKNSSGNRENWNIRFAWEFKPLSFVYLIFNNKTFYTTEKESDQHVIAKVSYLKQF
jgi:hypothetical protein